MKTDTGLAHDVFRRARHPLDPFFQPRSIAVIGATEKPGSVGRTILWNLVASPFGGTVYPVNPTRAERPRRQGLPVASATSAGRSTSRSS